MQYLKALDDAVDHDAKSFVVGASIKSDANTKFYTVSKNLRYISVRDLERAWFKGQASGKLEQQHAVMVVSLIQGYINNVDGPNNHSLSP